MEFGFELAHLLAESEEDIRRGHTRLARAFLKSLKQVKRISDDFPSR